MEHEIKCHQNDTRDYLISRREGRKMLEIVNMHIKYGIKIASLLRVSETSC